jgi:hypothetical protein
MKTYRLLPLAVLLAVSMSTWAADEAAKAPLQAASMPQDCAKVTKHDHGADRGTRAAAGTSAKAAKDCDAMSSAQTAKKKAKAHDHSKMHKTM